MAGIDAFDGLEKLLKAASGEAVRAAEDAAAKVYRDAIRAAAPRGRTGKLASSIRVFEGIDRRKLSGENRRRLLVGPEKRKAWYGYFVAKGRKAFEEKPKRKRALRIATAAGEVARASAKVGAIHGSDWFERASRGADEAARKAAEAAFDAALSRADGGIS